VALDGRLARRRPIRITLLVASVLSVLYVFFSLLPVLPMAQARDSTLAETIGWPSLVDQIHAAWNAIPPAERASAVIYTEDYSEAGAVNELGRGTGLPRAVSGQNNEWWWGPGNPAATTLLVVAPGGHDLTADLARYCTTSRTLGTIRNPAGIHNIEWGGHLYLCTGLRQPLGELWPQLRHYD
jgi:hypothetical protein